jgi:hypothetical protein
LGYRLLRNSASGQEIGRISSRASSNLLSFWLNLWLGEFMSCRLPILTLPPSPRRLHSNVMWHVKPPDFRYLGVAVVGPPASFFGPVTIRVRAVGVAPGGHPKMRRGRSGGRHSPQVIWFGWPVAACHIFAGVGALEEIEMGLVSRLRRW